MGINMEMQEFWSFVINALLFFFAYKIGQVSVWIKIGQIHKAEIQNNRSKVARAEACYHSRRNKWHFLCL